MKLIEAKFGKQPCSDLAAKLRMLAHAVERGEVVELVASYVEDGEYQILLAASSSDSLVLATLLQKRALDGMMA